MNRVQIFMHTLNAQMFTNNLIALHIFKNVIYFLLLNVMSFQNIRYVIIQRYTR